jgi:hypothetical protein
VKQAWLAYAVLGIFLWVGTAHAVDIVSDPLVEANTLQELIREAEAAAKRIEMVNNQMTQIVHLRNTLAAVSHGNLAALSQLAPELSALGLTNPIGADGTDLLRALSGLGSNLGQTGALAQDLMQSDQLFRSAGTDFRAVLMNQAAASIATQKALAELALNSSNERLKSLNTLRSGLDSTSDVKAATDANARLAGELAVAQTQGNQLAALRLLQNAQNGTTAAQEEQLWRCQAENLVAQAKAAQTAAQSGTVQLISSGGSTTNCTVSTTSGAVTNSSLAADSSGTLTSGLSSPSAITGSTALTTMQATSWGTQAASNATVLGVNPSALAATCVLESNCSANVGGTGTISGAFQMSNGTYAQTDAEVTASNPGLASQITSKNDPSSQSIAASQYLVDAASSLQSAGITNPTVLDTRSYYQFGPAYGAAVAQAQGNELMSDVLTGTSAKTLAANGINSDTTVAQWRSSVTSKIGDAANQPVLLGSSS